MVAGWPPAVDPWRKALAWPDWRAERVREMKGGGARLEAPLSRPTVAGAGGIESGGGDVAVRRDGEGGLAAPRPGSGKQRR